MLRLVTSRRAAVAAHSAIKRAFKRGARTVRQTLSTPGGQIVDAPVLVRRDLDLWAHFAGDINNNATLTCWWGIGEPSWQPTIEINIPTARTLHCYGQILVDDQDNILLAHKGGLGGGKFTVAPGPFGALINGFDREPVQDGPRERHFFVLGAISRPAQLIKRVSDYVHEAHRIRLLRRAGTRYTRVLKKLAGTALARDQAAELTFKDESIEGGRYSRKGEVAFRRLHGLVHRALAKELRTRAFSLATARQAHGLGPDLYTVNRTGRMNRLFEIKIGQGSQSTFTAIGQLLVYSATQRTRPMKILVTKGLPGSPQFQAALRAHHIKVLYYTMDEKSSVEFKDLDSILAIKQRIVTT
jgi:hypothetical protein